MTFSAILDTIRTIGFLIFVGWLTLGWIRFLHAQRRAPRNVAYRGVEVYSTDLLLAYDDWRVAKRLGLTPSQLEDLSLEQYDATLAEIVGAGRARRLAGERRRWRGRAPR